MDVLCVVLFVGEFVRRVDVGIRHISVLYEEHLE